MPRVTLIIVPLIAILLGILFHGERSAQEPILEPQPAVSPGDGGGASNEAEVLLAALSSREESSQAQEVLHDAPLSVPALGSVRKSALLSEQEEARIRDQLERFEDEPSLANAYTLTTTYARLRLNEVADYQELEVGKKVSLAVPDGMHTFVHSGSNQGGWRYVFEPGRFPIYTKVKSVPTGRYSPIRRGIGVPEDLRLEILLEVRRFLGDE